MFTQSQLEEILRALSISARIFQHPLGLKKPLLDFFDENVRISRGGKYMDFLGVTIVSAQQNNKAGWYIFDNNFY